MRPVYAPVYSNQNATSSEVTGRIANFYTVGIANLPSEDSGLLVVMQQLAQAFYGNIGFSHDMPSASIGQRPVSVTSAAPALPFYAMAA